MDAWSPKFVDALARHHRVITFDNEGIGASTLGPGTLSIRRMGDDTASLIRALRLGRPDVLGWSMGGMIAQAFARRHPTQVRRLVLCATSPGDGGATGPTPDALSGAERVRPGRRAGAPVPARPRRRRRRPTSRRLARYPGFRPGAAGREPSAVAASGLWLRDGTPSAGP